MNRYLSTLVGIALVAGPALAAEVGASAMPQNEEVIDCASELLSSADTEACLAIEGQNVQAMKSDEQATITDGVTNEESVMDRGGVSGGRGFGRSYGRGYGYGYGRGYVSRYRGRYYRWYPGYYYPRYRHHRPR